MKNQWSRLLTLALALLMVLSCLAFVGCGNDTPKNPSNDPGTTPGSDPTPDSSKGEDYLLSIPKQNFNNRTYTFFAPEGMREKEVYFESEDDALGDTVETAIFYRNNRVGEYFGIDFEIVTDPNTGWDKKDAFISRIQQSYQAGDQDFQQISVYEAYAAQLAVLGLAADANSLESIDFSSPWYVQSWQENTLINDRSYMVLSDLSYSMWKYINAMYFNKQISDELGITEALYTMAEDGELTLDYVMSCAEVVAEDDGNDLWDENDKYGICFNTFNCRAFLTWFDVPVVAMNEDGEYEDVYYSEKSESVFATMHSYIFDNNYVYMNNKVNPNDHNNFSVTIPMFMEDRLLFLPATLERSQDLREMDGAFGILPMPKYDEQQKNYRSHSNDTFTVFMFPAQSDDLEFCATVFDALSAENKYSVIPAYYDVVLKGRTTKDEQSIAMLDLIRDNLYFDFAMAHLASLGNMWTHFGGAIANPNNTSFKSTYDTQSSMYQEKLDEIMEAYWNIR